MRMNFNGGYQGYRLSVNLFYLIFCLAGVHIILNALGYHFFDKIFVVAFAGYCIFMGLNGLFLANRF